MDYVTLVSGPQLQNHVSWYQRVFEMKSSEPASLAKIPQC